MAWNGIMYTMVAKEKPKTPRNGDYEPEGWTPGHQVPVPGQDDDKSLWVCAIVAMEGDEGEAYMTWTAVQKVSQATVEQIQIKAGLRTAAPPSAPA